MHKILLIILLLAATGSLEAQKNSPEIEARFKTLKWLEGNWEGTNRKPGLTANEKWHIEAPYELRGFGVTMKGPDTIFLEKIQIIIRTGDLYYVAEVKENGEPVYFKFTSLTTNGFVCENPLHDFPKKIEYSLIGSNLTVVISGDGKSQSYLFARRS